MADETQGTASVEEQGTGETPQPETIPTEGEANADPNGDAESSEPSVAEGEADAEPPAEAAQTEGKTEIPGDNTKYQQQIDAAISAEYAIKAQQASASGAVGVYYDAPPVSARRNVWVGDIVVYHPGHPTKTAPGTYDTVEDSAIFANGVTVDHVLPAIVTRVYQEHNGQRDAVNLLVFSDGGGIVRKEAVYQGDEMGQWEWPHDVD